MPKARQCTVCSHISETFNPSSPLVVNFKYIQIFFTKLPLNDKQLWCKRNLLTSLKTSCLFLIDLESYMDTAIRLYREKIHTDTRSAMICSIFRRWWNSSTICREAATARLPKYGTNLEGPSDFDRRGIHRPILLGTRQHRVLDLSTKHQPSLR